MIARRITRFPWTSFFRQWKASFAWSIFEIFLKGSKQVLSALKSVFVLAWASLDVYFSRKHMKYICLGEQPDSSVRRANNRLLSKRFLRPWKAFLSWFELHWTYISRENTWSIFVRANNQIPVFPWGNNRFPSKSFFRPWKAFLSWFEHHLDVYFSRKKIKYIRLDEQPDSSVHRRGE